MNHRKHNWKVRAGPQCTCLPASPISNGPISATEIQLLKIIEKILKKKLFLVIRFLALQWHSLLKMTGRKACTLTVPC
ncbi:hypothetical protein [Clostridium beijerinckii]|jgi:hypothetical protein|uniref:hypothetical protein n=1 Tax=Clostridium beijerinckii TaxID=1520 RepID=UPI0011158781|nr:hypothetical protein [Clostridium beijerinckii]NRU48130.1 hypothetical protein [Clostridium beijerinckii]